MEATDIKHATKLDLLAKKLDLILRIRDLTESVDLSGSNAEERYITLITRREAIISQLKAIDVCLFEYAPEEGEEELLALISEVTEQILEMDDELALRVPDLMKNIKNRLKQIKRGRNINRAYHADMIGMAGEGSYDLRK